MPTHRQLQKAANGISQSGGGLNLKDMKGYLKKIGKKVPKGVVRAQVEQELRRELGQYGGAVYTKANPTDEQAMEYFNASSVGDKPGPLYNGWVPQDVYERHYAPRAPAPKERVYTSSNPTDEETMGYLSASSIGDNPGPLYEGWVPQDVYSRYYSGSSGRKVQRRASAPKPKSPKSPKSKSPKPKSKKNVKFNEMPVSTVADTFGTKWMTGVNQRADLDTLGPAMREGKNAVYGEWPDKPCKKGARNKARCNSRAYPCWSDNACWNHDGDQSVRALAE